MIGKYTDEVPVSKSGKNNHFPLLGSDGIVGHDSLFFLNLSSSEVVILHKMSAR